MLGIRRPADLRIHASRGAVFETFALAELIKAYAHRGRRPPLFFWRDSAGHEVDFVIDQGTRLLAIEAKSGETAPGSFFEGLSRWRRLLGEPAAPAVLLYGGDDGFTHGGIAARSWRSL